MSYRIDGIITTKWWIVFLPYLVLCTAQAIINLFGLPVLIKRTADNKDLPTESRIALAPMVVSYVNYYIWVIALYCLVLRLDNIWKTTYTVALIPYYIYSISNIIEHRLHRAVDEEYKTDDLSMFLYILAIFLGCLKVDGIAHYSWDTVFIPVWIEVAMKSVVPIFVSCIAAGHVGDYLIDTLIECLYYHFLFYSQDQHSACLCILSAVAFRVFIALGILNTIKGKWHWKVSKVMLPIMIVVGL